MSQGDDATTTPRSELVNGPDAGCVIRRVGKSSERRAVLFGCTTRGCPTLILLTTILGAFCTIFPSFPYPTSIMPRRRTGFTAWCDRVLSSFSIEDLFVRKRPPGPPRTIFINEPLPETYYDQKQRVLKEHQYNSNQVITSKYTLFTFLPRNLLEQFRRIANV